MQACFNHPPDRLRLRFPELRRQPLRAARVAAAIRRIDGVVSVDATAVTGGLLIVYDVAGADQWGFWPALQEALAAHGLSEANQRGTPQSGRPGAAPLVNSVADKVVGALVEKLVERSALALVAALL